MLSLAHRANGTMNITGVLAHQADSQKVKVVVMVVGLFVLVNLLMVGDTERWR